MIGQSVAHYRILDRLGRGGMGVVYLAEDTRLNRRVALKCLPPEYSSDSAARTRLLAEARAAAALDDPNICTIHDVAEVDGRLYVAMAHYEGETLRQRLDRGRVSTADALDIAMQIARGLSRAHAAGIVHRDIKPANVFVTKSGLVKILDFGLAKTVGGASITATGSTLGTPAYMSPEQARGERVDQRSDVWSLGVVMYEMLAGDRPFRGTDAHALIFSILSTQPRPIVPDRSDVPAPLAALVMQMIEKDPLRRPSLHAVLAAAEPQSQPAATPGSGKQSVVVLPFGDISPGKDNEFFADGLTEEIIAALSKINALRVISRTSAMRFKGAQKDIPAIARQLDVQYVLEGSVRKAGNHLRIMAQLIDAATDEPLWTESYRGTLDDVFEIQEQVARAIAGELRVKLTPEESKDIAARPIASPAAYECYLRAKSEIWRFTEEGLERGLRDVENALELVGENALLYATQGSAYWQYVNLGINPSRTDEYLDKTEAVARKIQSLEPRSSHADRLLSLVSFHRGRVAESYRHAQEAIEKDPKDLESLFVFAMWSAFVGMPEPARRAAQEVVRADPLMALGHHALGVAELTDGRFDAAVTSFQRAYELDPGNPTGGFWYIQTLAIQGKRQQAIELADRLAGAQPDELWPWLIAFFRCGLAADRERAQELWSADREAIVRIDPQYALNVTETYALLGEVDEALRWLEVAIERGSLCYRYLAEVDPFLASLRSHRRFAELMDRCRVERERVLAAG